MKNAACLLSASLSCRSQDFSFNFIQVRVKMKPSLVCFCVATSVFLLSFDLVASYVLPVPGDCTKFQVCDYSGCFVFNCGAGTEFNPKTTVCDYPLQDRVSCGARQSLGLGLTGGAAYPGGQAGPVGPGGPIGPIGGGVPAVQCPGGAACGGYPGGGQGPIGGGQGPIGGYPGAQGPVGGYPGGGASGNTIPGSGC